MKKYICIFALAALLLQGCGVSGENAASADGALGTGQNAVGEQSGTEPMAESGMSSENGKETEKETQSGMMPETGNVAAPVIIVLDPGHDSEYCTRNQPQLGVNEQDLNLAIALACRDALRAYDGIEVYMTREDGTCPDAGNKGVDCIKARTDYAESVHADWFISFHNNATGGGYPASAEGTEVYVSKYPAFYEDAKEFGGCILTELEKLGLGDRGVLTRSKPEKGNYDDGTVKDWYYLISNNVDNNRQAMIIEHAYMDNAQDNTFLKDDENLKTMGEADAAGIAAYFSLELKQEN